MRMPSNLSRAAGFTLIELMVTIMVGAILASIAVPAYTAQVRKSRRTEARTAVLDLATREERYFSVNNTYSNLDTDLGYGTSGNAITTQPVGSSYYTVGITITAADPTTTPPTQAAYSITATTTGTQTKDTQCHTFTIDQTGLQTSSPATNCWN